MSADEERQPPASPAAAPGRGGDRGRSNPFRRNKPNRILDYMIGGRHVHVSSDQYECYERIWRERITVTDQVSGYIAGERDINFGFLQKTQPEP